MPESEYQDWQKRVIRECIRICSGPVFYNHKVRYAFSRRGTYYHPLQWLGEFPLWCEIIWDRCGGQPWNGPRYTLSDERVFMLGKPRKWNGTEHSNIWRIHPTANEEHPCSFPEELVLRCIRPTT